MENISRSRAVNCLLRLTFRNVRVKTWWNVVQAVEAVVVECLQTGCYYGCPQDAGCNATVYPGFIGLSSAAERDFVGDLSTGERERKILQKTVFIRYDHCLDWSGKLGNEWMEPMKVKNEWMRKSWRRLPTSYRRRRGVEKPGPAFDSGTQHTAVDLSSQLSEIFMFAHRVFEAKIKAKGQLGEVDVWTLWCVVEECGPSR